MAHQRHLGIKMFNKRRHFETLDVNTKGQNLESHLHVKAHEFGQMPMGVGILSTEHSADRENFAETKMRASFGTLFRDRNILP